MNVFYCEILILIKPELFTGHKLWAGRKQNELVSFPLLSGLWAVESQTCETCEIGLSRDRGRCDGRRTTFQVPSSNRGPNFVANTFRLCSSLARHIMSVISPSRSYSSRVCELWRVTNTAFWFGHVRIHMNTSAVFMRVATEEYSDTRSEFLRMCFCNILTTVKASWSSKSDSKNCILLVVFLRIGRFHTTV